jgi:tetratricopeptide (TPR) repeat protein
MDAEKVPSREELERLMAELPSKVDALLQKCCPGTSSIVPDYATFYVEARALLKPFGEYDDAEFHAGRCPGVFRSAVRVFAKKKWECYEGKRGTTDAWPRFKLLFHFFGYSGETPPIQVFDLEYQFENERDPKRYKEILEEAGHVVKKSSSGIYFEALLAANSGDLDKALKLCDRAIAKFPGNTHAYELKARILQAKAKKVLEEGLRQEPRDRALKFSFDIERHLQSLREKCAEGLLDEETVIEHLERSIEEGVQREGVDLGLYRKEAEISLGPAADVQEETMAFLCTGEFLLAKLPTSLDCSPSAIEFCKAVETELHNRLFDPFKSWCQKHLPESTEGRDQTSKFREFIYKGGKLALGQMAMILQLLTKEKLLATDTFLAEFDRFVHLFPRRELLSVLTPWNVEKYRNSAAHLDLFTLEKARETKAWCYSIISLLGPSTRGGLFKP